jgi:wyosine [tRNA(Phe)-imidazoG37] synthetase (radical SAM superfamily)
MSVIMELPLQTAAGLTKAAGTASGYPRDFLDNRFVYAIISPRARGLSLGVNMNPDKFCNFDCAYCEADRTTPALESKLDIDVMVAELERTLELVRSGRLRDYRNFQDAPEELLKLRHVALSGDGEPTLCPNFVEVVEAVIQVRARGRYPFFKIVLLTNASSLDRPEVLEGVRLLNPRDEVWAKLDAGTQDYMDRVNKADCTLETVLANIRRLGLQRPVIIQSLFPAISREGPPASEVEAYVQRLKELKDAGAQIPLVQIYSASRPTPHSECGHLPLRILSAIARRVREVAGLRTEVF